MRILAALTVAVLSTTAMAQETLTVHNDRSIEQGLRSWMTSEPKLLAKIESAIKKSRSGKEMSDLRDAVAEKADAVKLRDAIAKSEGAKKRALIAALPGMTPNPFGGCAVLEACAQAPSSFHVDHSAGINDAVVGLVRPWINLQKARGQGLAFDAANDRGDRLMKVRLNGLENATLSVHLSAVPSGGFNVWLRGSQDAAKLYETERRTALAWARRE